MINYIFTTKRYDEEAKRYSASEEVQKLMEKMNKTSDYEPDRYDRFPGNYHKVVVNNFRHILTRKVIKMNGEDVRIYVALCVLKRGDNEYVKFQTARTSDTDRDSITDRSSLDWEVYIKKVQDDIDKPIEDIKKPNLTEAEMNFVSTHLNINHKLFDVTIYETKNWVDDVQEVKFTDFSNAASTIERYIVDHLDSEDGWYIIEFKQKAILIYHNKEKQDWVLDRIFDKKEDGIYKDLIPPKKPIDFQRGYPFDSLSDKDEWRLMEQDKKSNMVLSQQQVEIVSNEDIHFPLFITGRAGSGKSTMLQYLFAEIILRYLYTSKFFNDGLKLPVYLSYSSNLITDAQKLCNTLFEKTKAYKDQLSENQISYREDISPLMDKMFFVFHDLLRKCIDRNAEGESLKLFPIEKYITFPGFNYQWEKKFGKIREAAKKYGPTISWHVIRTYIKGWDSNKYMTPDEYATIGEKNQTVLPETFKVIYEEVWEKWYSQMNDVWDDQDIVRYCLENNLVDERYSAVFCDESQDFTRAEIDFILRLSSFSNRSLQHVNEIKRLPFVFVGDEFQTLNPTGFSWRSLSSYFTESLCNSTGLEQYKNELGIPDPIELSENFRSTRQVVKLANRIQLLRASRFGEYSKPQTPHFSEDGNSVYCISPSNKYIFDKLKEKQVFLIVPAADGESVEEYIAKTPLKDQIRFEKGVPQDITILNPTQAKGLEYPNVAIYGFNCDGPNSQLKLAKLLDWFNNPTEDAISDIELKYQISNAYVAVTRAGSNLYILDDFNDGSFWAFAFNHDDPKMEAQIKQLQKQMFSKLNKSQQEHWMTCENSSKGESLPDEERLNRNLGWIDSMPEGVDITDDNLRYLKSEEHKNDLENRAEALHDPKLMRRAACIHRSAGNKKDEARCKAKAFNFEEDYLQAANWFEAAEDYDSAVENYWTQLNLHPEKSVISKIADLRDHSQNAKVRLCVMCANPSVRNLKLAIDDTLNALEINKSEQATLGAWQFVLNYLLQVIQPKKNDGNSDIPVIVKKCDELQKCNISLDQSKLAALAYYIGVNKYAISIWENMDKANRPKEYYKAKLDILKYPDSIEFYEGTGNENWMDELIQVYRQKTDTSLNDSQKHVIATVVNARGNRQEFMKFLPFMLRAAHNIEVSKRVLNDSERFESNLNKHVLEAIIETRYSDLHDWKRPRVNYADLEANTLFDAIEEIKRMRKDDFVDYINRSLEPKDMRVIDFCRRYNTFSRKAISIVVFAELGKRFEERDSFIDAIRYYEWAKNQSDDKDFKRAMDIRWIVCKERQAAYEKDDSTKKAVYTKEAIDKRRELQIHLDEKLAESPDLKNANYWEGVFAFYAGISNEQITATKKREKKVETKAKESKTTPSTDRSKLKKQELRYNEYSVVFLPDKGNVVIQDTVNLYQVRIKDGIFPDNGDFILKDSRVYVSEDDTPTPFVFERNENDLVIKIFDDDIDTGLSIVVNLK